MKENFPYLVSFVFLCVCFIASSNVVPLRGLMPNSRTSSIDWLNRVPRQEAQQYLTRVSRIMLPEVKEVNVTYNDMYAHIQTAFNLMKPNFLSFASLTEDGSINGISLTIRFSQLTEMHSPGVISEVVTFVRQCYASEMGNETNNVWIVILKGSESPEILRNLISTTTTAYKSLPVEMKTGLLIWGSRKSQGSHLAELGFQHLTCGASNRFCDWGALNIAAHIASDICLYKV